MSDFAGIKDHSEYIQTTEALVSELAFTKDEKTYVNDQTLKQWKCKEWYLQKAAFITASMCKRVYTWQETVEKNRDNRLVLITWFRPLFNPRVI